MSNSNWYLKRHFFSNVHKALAFLCIAAFGTFITLLPIYAAVAIPVALTYGLTIAIPAIFFLIASVCQMFGNSKCIDSKVAQKIVHRGKIFYNLGLSALGIGLFFIGVSCWFFPGLVVIAGLSSWAWIIGLTSSVVGMFFIYRSYKNLKIGSISDIKRYVLEIMGYNVADSNTGRKIFQIVNRNIENLERIAQKDINQDNKNSDVQKDKQSLIMQRRALDLYKIISRISSVMDKCKDILIFHIIHKSDPSVNRIKYELDLTGEDQDHQTEIIDIVEKCKEDFKTEISKLLNNQPMRPVSKILKYMSDEINKINKEEKINDHINCVIGLIEKFINKTLSNLSKFDNDTKKDQKNLTNEIQNSNIKDINKEDDDLKKKITFDSNVTNLLKKFDEEQEDQYEKLLGINGTGFSKLNQLNSAQELNHTSIYEKFCHYYRELSSEVSICSTKDKRALLDLLEQDLQFRVPSAKNHKTRRNIFFLLLGIILTLGGILSFIYPTLAAFIGLFGLLGELFAGVVIICGLSLVYESIKNFIVGTIVGFERSLYELIASNCNDSDKEKIYNEVVMRLIPLKTSKEDDNLEGKIKINNGSVLDDNNDDDNIDKEYYAAMKKSIEDKKNAKIGYSYNGEDDQEYKTELPELEDENQNSEDENQNSENKNQNSENKLDNLVTFPLLVKLPECVDINKDVFGDQCLLIEEQEELLKLNLDNAAQILSSEGEEIGKDDKNRLKNRLKEKFNSLNQQRRKILERTTTEAKEYVHTANFVIKQNHIKLNSIVQTVLSDLDNPGIDSKIQVGVGAPKGGGGRSMLEFKHENGK